MILGKDARVDNFRVLTQRLPIEHIRGGHLRGWVKLGHRRLLPVLRHWEILPDGATTFVDVTGGFAMLLLHARLSIKRSAFAWTASADVSSDFVAVPDGPRLRGSAFNNLFNCTSMGDLATELGYATWVDLVNGSSTGFDADFPILVHSNSATGAFAISEHFKFSFAYGGPNLSKSFISLFRSCTAAARNSTLKSRLLASASSMSISAQ
jgi:hypothetical protein